MKWRASTCLHGSPVTRYHHGDHLGTLRLRTFPNGVADATRVFSAFGERLAGPGEPDRYGYVGAHGYQAHADFPFLHVGARYYDPASGRFLQRDPIGIRGGFNAYIYVGNNSLKYIDPLGLEEEKPIIVPVEYYVRKEGRVVLGTFGYYGALVGEITCASIGLGWAWGKNRFRTGDLIRKKGEARDRLKPGSPAPPSQPPQSPPAPPPAPTSPSPPTSDGSSGALPVVW